MNELEKHVEGNLLQFLGKYKGQIEGVLSRQIDPKRFAKLIIGQVNRTPKLLGCTPMSVVNCVVQAASLGLELRPNQAYLVPFKDKFGRLQCNLLIDYRGKVDLAKRSGAVDDIEARLVYANDEFRCEFGAQPIFRHVPRLTREVSGHLERVGIDERGQVVLGYAIAWLKARVHIETMTYDEIERIRAKSKAKKEDSPWFTDWDQMARKTLVHRLCNYIPQSPEIAASQEIDDRSELELPLDNVLDVAPEDEDKPILEQSAEAQDGVLVRRLTEEGVEEKQAVNIAASRAEKRSAVKHRPKNGFPVFDDFPPLEQVADGQQLWVKGTLYRFEEERSAFAPVETASATSM